MDGPTNAFGERGLFWNRGENQPCLPLSMYQLLSRSSRCYRSRFLRPLVSLYFNSLLNNKVVSWSMFFNCWFRLKFILIQEHCRFKLNDLHTTFKTASQTAQHSMWLASGYFSIHCWDHDESQCSGKIFYRGAFVIFNLHCTTNEQKQILKALHLKYSKTFFSSRDITLIL